MRTFWRSFRSGEGCLLRAEKHKAQREASADTLLLSVIFSFPEVDRRWGSGCQVVAMMQSAQPCQEDYFAVGIRILRSFTARRSFLGEGKVCSVFVVVTDVLAH